MAKLFNVSSSPHVRSEETTRSIMMDVAIAMLPATAFGVFQFGLHALLVIIATVFACVLSEYVFESNQETSYHQRFQCRCNRYDPCTELPV